jgi:hypothetical protein
MQGVVSMIACSACSVLRTMGLSLALLASALVTAAADDQHGGYRQHHRAMP